MNALKYAQQLVEFNSVSSRSNSNVSDFVQEQLKLLGCDVERVNYEDENGVAKSNVIGKLGRGPGGLAYFGHTDVVPADDWMFDEHGPFQPTVKDDRLYGRGSCDMKGSVACMLAAIKQVVSKDLQSPIYVTCTADEEIGYGGARKVVECSEIFQEMVAGEARGIVGEPTMLEVVHGHKGTYGIVATSRGEAAHSSTRAGLNANLAMIPFLQEMKTIHDESESNREWQNDEFDPPTISWNIGINDHTHAINIKPPQSVCTVYFRPMPGQDPEKIVQRARQAAELCGLEFSVPRTASPMYVDPKSPYVLEVLELANREKPQTVSYGTDGCIFHEMKNLVVLGPGSIEKAHTADEWIALEQLEKGTELYQKLIDRWCI